MYDDCMKGFGGRRMPEEPLEIVKRTAELLSPESEVLDMAVGEGRHALYLAERDMSVTGVDILKDRLGQIREKAQEDWQIELIEKNALEFDTDRQFDLVLCTGLIHFFEEEDVKQMIEKMKRLTKEGGYNLIAARMDQNRRGSLLHLLDKEELKEYYQDDWEIIEYQEIEKEYPPRRVQVILSRKTK